jgi:hypothetical protein
MAKPHATVKISSAGALLFAALYPQSTDIASHDDGSGRSIPYLLTTCSAIASAAAQYHRYTERECNGESIPAEQITKLESKIRSLAASLGAGYGVKFSGDPRGACVFITTPDGRSDDWGGRGICALQE